MAAKANLKTPISRESRAITNFYPLYGEGRDRVSPVRPVQPVEFQEVVPYYRLSSTETRDEGLGPMFEERGFLLITAQYKRKQASSPELSSHSEKKSHRYYKETMFDFCI